MGLDAGRLHIGKGSITFGSGAVLYAGEMVVRPKGVIVEAPDIEGCGAPLDIRVTNRTLEVYFKSRDLTAESVAHASGIASARIASGINNLKNVTPLASDTSVDTGSAAIALTRDDGKQCRWYIPKAAWLPTNEDIPIGQGKFFSAGNVLKSIDDGTGSGIPYRFEESTV